MKFIASRDLRVKPGQVWKDLKKEQLPPREVSNSIPLYVGVPPKR